MLQSRGQKPLEFVVGGLLLFVAAAYIVELIFSRPHLPSLLEGALLPGLPNSDAVYLAAGVLGATVMPHVIYLHSALTQHTQDQGSVSQRLHTTRIDVAIAMTIAGFVNLAMMAMAAAGSTARATSRWPSWNPPTRPSLHCWVRRQPPCLASRWSPPV